MELPEPPKKITVTVTFKERDALILDRYCEVYQHTPGALVAQIVKEWLAART